MALLPTAATAATQVEVVRAADRWTATFDFDRASPVWVMNRSAVAREDQKPWRPRSWTVLTPGVRLVRFGEHDAFVAVGGRKLPHRVKVRFTPFAQDLIASYDPALIFTDGTVAIYDQQFHLFPVGSIKQAASLPAELSDVPAADTPTRVRFRDTQGAVMHAGRSSPSVTLSADWGSYVLFGKPRPMVTPAMATLIDPQLPGWLRESLEATTPEVLAYYTRRLGPAPGTKPTFLISWAGPTPKLVSMGGSVLPSLVTMRFEGAGLLDASPKVASAARWFIAHESAHFWLGQAVQYQFGRDAWITEGGADLLAVRTVSAIDPGYDARAELQEGVTDCVKLTVGKSIASAEQRNEHRAYYACGALFGLIVEAAQRRASGGDFHDFVRALIAANATDKTVSKDDWFAAAVRAGVPAAQVEAMRLLVERGSPDPAKAYADLFAAAGIPHRLEGGKLILQ